MGGRRRGGGGRSGGSARGLFSRPKHLDAAPGFPEVDAEGQEQAPEGPKPRAPLRALPEPAEERPQDRHDRGEDDEEREGGVVRKKMKEEAHRRSISTGGASGANGTRGEKESAGSGDADEEALGGAEGESAGAVAGRGAGAGETEGSAGGALVFASVVTRVKSDERMMTPAMKAHRYMGDFSKVPTHSMPFTIFESVPISERSFSTFLERSSTARSAESALYETELRFLTSTSCVARSSSSFFASSCRYSLAFISRCESSCITSAWYLSRSASAAPGAVLEGSGESFEVGFSVMACGDERPATAGASEKQPIGAKVSGQPERDAKLLRHVALAFALKKERLSVSKDGERERGSLLCSLDAAKLRERVPEAPDEGLREAGRLCRFSNGLPLREEGDRFSFDVGPRLHGEGSKDSGEMSFMGSSRRM